MAHEGRETQGIGYCTGPSRFRALATFALAALLGATGGARAQDLYDPTVLRTFDITFHDANWLALLRANYASETNILADVVVDGVSYPDVGVRIRGNTSYTALPAGSEKFSLKLEMDYVDPDQELLGYDTINLNNGFHDPTFSREVVYNNYVAQFIPNPRANHALVTLNGQNWGVYVNVQQPDKRMLRDYFANADGLRIRCANRPNGPGLAYNGPDASGYADYEIQADGGLADPVGALIAVANALSNEPLATWPNIDPLFAMDPSIWSVVLENALTDDDSYVNKGCDFMTYRDPVDGRTHLLQRDANETFTQATWAPTRNFTAVNKPVLNRVLAVAEQRQRYMSHYRTILRDMNWAYFGPRFTAQRNLIDAAVQADPKKLYSHALFQANFSTTVSLPYAGPAGGNVIGLEEFVTQRAAILGGSAELAATGPTISAVQASIADPDPVDPVWITAAVAAAGSPVSLVELYFRPQRQGVYLRTPMLDDGLSGDGTAGDGVYGTLLPVAATPGQRVDYYVAATAGNAFLSRSFAPALAERGPLHVDYFLGTAQGLRITEWMYSGLGGEFIEFTNLSGSPIDLAGWSMDDSNAVPGAFGLGAGGTLAAGESLVVTEAVAATFRAAWNLPSGSKVIGELGVASGNNLGRSDQIHLYDAAGTLADRLYYGDQTYPGTIRTQNISGWAPCAALGLNAVASWQLSAVGDAQGSVASNAGDVGSPGTHDLAGCVPDGLYADGFE